MNIKKTSGRVEAWLTTHNYPFSDNIPFIPSAEKFDDGSIFGVEIPVINSMKVLEKTIHWLEHYNVRCDRFNETKGSFLLSDSEIKEMLHLCSEKNIGMVFALSPRPEYDIKASFYRSEFGLEQGRRLNNNNAIANSIEEAMRLAELGCRGIIVYDIGVLHILSEMRSEGILPIDLMFKSSSHCMATNPVIASILQKNGANSITTIHDASLIVLQEMRRLCPGLVLDVPTDVYADKGGYIRFNELAEIVQIASPVILKMGASAQNHPYDAVSDEIIHTRVKRTMVGLQHLNRIIKNDQQMSNSSKMRCLPKRQTVTRKLSHESQPVV